MPGPTDTQDLKEQKTDIENEKVTTELDNIIQANTGTTDNEVEPEDVTQNETDAQKEEAKEDEKQEEEAPEVKMDGNNLVSTEGNVSVDLTQNTANTDVANQTETQVTDEEKEGVKEASKSPSDIFETNTGASQVADVGKANDTQQEDVDGTKQDTQEEENNVLDADTETGAKKGLSKKKKFFFSVISGLKRAKKSVGNFFKKKLPSAFKTAGSFAKSALKYTPVAPLIDLFDKVAADREKTRPEREAKARKKKEEEKAKWLLDQDEKRLKEEEKKRIEKEKKELEEKAKAALWEYKKQHNTLDYRAAMFFKGIWGGIKTGASWIGNKIKNSKAGIITATYAAKTAKLVKRVVNDVKEVVGGVVLTVVGKIEQMKDEYDEFSFEDRMTRVAEEEKKKKEKGEDVPKEDYRTRYLALVEELKGKLASTRENIRRRGEIEEALSEMEDNTAVTLPNGEEVDADEWRTDDKELGSDSDLANFLLDIGTSLIPGKDIAKIVNSLGKMGSESGRVDKFRKRKNMMDAIHTTSKNELIRRVSRYAKDHAELKEMQAGFDVALNILNGAAAAGTVTGMVPLAQGAKFASSVTSGIKSLASSSKKRSGVKNGIKDMLGGREGYYALKAKYQMHAPEMRRAVRDALGVATSEDAVTADKWELSHLMSERAKQGAMDKETERMVSVAGGTSEKKFDALQGAGSTVRRRFADRRKRMTA